MDDPLETALLSGMDLEGLTSLSPDKLAKVARAVRRLKLLEEAAVYEDSLLEFASYVWPVVEPAIPFIRGWAIEAISEHLEAVTYGHIKRLLINVPPGFSKEIQADEPVLTNRGRIRLGDVRIGDRILTHRGRYRRVSAVHEKGMQPILTITTNAGRAIKAEPSHPFLTPQGWVCAKDLKIDDVLAAVTPLEEEFVDQATPEEARLLGYLVGDGSVTHSPAFTNMEPDCLLDFVRCANSLGFQATKRASNPNSKMKADTIGLKGALSWLDKHNLRGKDSYKKRIPPLILASSKNIIENFLGAYWSCDGTIVIRHSHTRNSIFISACSTVSEGLAGDIQHALLRLGINSRIRHRISKMVSKKQPGGQYHHWVVMTCSHEDTVKFKDMAGLCVRKNSKLQGLPVKKFVQGPLFEDAIIKIEESDASECRCLTVEEDHSFTANDIAVRNSLLTDVFWPAWEWGPKNMPWLRYVCASYSNHLTERDNLRCRNIVCSDRYRRLWGDRFGISNEQFTKIKFQNTKTGWKLATSVGGIGVGERGNRFIIDDANNTMEMESEVTRNTTNMWFTEVVPDRLNSQTDSAIVVIQQRLHEDDVSGTAITREMGYTHLCIPMEYDSGRHCVTVLGLDEDGDEVTWEDPRTEDCELAWPERFPQKAVDDLKRDKGPYAFAGQYQQSPEIRGGSIIKRDFWKDWESPRWPTCEYVLASLDTAYTAKEQNDCSALTIWGVFRDLAGNPNIILLNAWQERLEFNDLVTKVIDSCTKDQRNISGPRFEVDRLLIENKAAGHSVAQELHRLIGFSGQFGVELIDPRQFGDKEARVHSVQHLFSEGMIWVPWTDPDGYEWVNLVVNQCAAFPKGSRDDLVDSMSQALRYLRAIGFALRREERGVEVDEELRYRGRTQALYPV